MELIHEENGHRGKFVLQKDLQLVGEVAYVYAGDDKIILEHTEVNEEFEGQGLAKQLVNAVVDMAREKKIKVVPLCPYANALFHRKPDEYADVWFGK